MALALKWDITYKCNLLCEHCLNGDYLDNNSKELTYDEILAIIEDINNEVGIESINFLGGEPTVRNDFSLISNYLKDKKIRFGFNTNGLLLKSKKIQEVINNEYLSNVIVSLEGHTREINDTIRGKNVFDKTIEGIKYLREIKLKNSLIKFEISVNTVVTKLNYMYIKDIIQLCATLGVDEINFLQLIQTGNAIDKDLALDEEQNLELIKVIAEEYKDKKDIIRINPKFLRPMAKDYCESKYGLEFPITYHGCGAGGTFAYINNIGKIYPCDRYRNILDPNKNNDKYLFNKNNFIEIWGSKEFNEPYERTEGDILYKDHKPCNQCKYLQKECYPCPAGIQIGKEFIHQECLAYTKQLEGSIK